MGNSEKIFPANFDFLNLALGERLAPALIRVDGALPAQRAALMVEQVIPNLSPEKAVYAVDTGIKLGNLQVDLGERRPLPNFSLLAEVLVFAREPVEGELTQGLALYSQGRRACGQHTTRFKLRPFSYQDIISYCSAWLQKHLEMNVNWTDESGNDWRIFAAVASVLMSHPNMIDLGLLHEQGKLHSLEGVALKQISPYQLGIILQKSLQSDWMLPLLSKEQHGVDWLVHDFNRSPPPQNLFSPWFIDQVEIHPMWSELVSKVPKVQRIQDIISALGITTPHFIIPWSIFLEHLKEEGGHMSLQNNLMVLTGWRGDVGISVLRSDEGLGKTAPHLTLKGGSVFPSCFEAGVSAEQNEAIADFIRQVHSGRGGSFKKDIFVQIYLSPWSTPGVAGATVRFDDLPRTPKREEAVVVEMSPRWPRGFDLSRANKAGLPACSIVLGGECRQKRGSTWETIMVDGDKRVNRIYQELSAGASFYMNERRLLQLINSITFRHGIAQIWNTAETRLETEIASLALELYWDPVLGQWIPFDYTAH
ncbi:hypothetical protein KKD62_02225 [Patescibacteria group bacterium]|nr:hypothetical protein [Patescibacteria group bacterium]MBU1931686.1 hypothetical protein [Patescibacteria group bacterium]